MPEDGPVGLVICDDHVVFADALAAVLTQHGFAVRAVVSRLPAVVPALREHQPDVCLLDRRFGELDGLAVLEGIRLVASTTKVLVLTADPTAAGADEAIEAGAAGFVQKTFGVLTLVESIRRVVGGELVVNSHWANPRPSGGERGDALRLATHLTAREWECLAMLVEGLGTTQMAARLGVATTTVRSHVQALLSKLGVHSRLEAASLAVRHSLLERAGAAGR